MVIKQQQLKDNQLRGKWGVDANGLLIMLQIKQSHQSHYQYSVQLNCD